MTRPPRGGPSPRPRSCSRASCPAARSRSGRWWPPRAAARSCCSRRGRRCRSRWRAGSRSRSATRCPGSAGTGRCWPASSPSPGRPPPPRRCARRCSGRRARSSASSSPWCSCRGWATRPRSRWSSSSSRSSSASTSSGCPTPAWRSRSRSSSPSSTSCSAPTATGCSRCAWARPRSGRSSVASSRCPSSPPPPPRRSRPPARAWPRSCARRPSTSRRCCTAAPARRGPTASRSTCTRGPAHSTPRCTSSPSSGSRSRCGSRRGPPARRASVTGRLSAWVRCAARVRAVIHAVEDQWGPPRRQETVHRAMAAVRGLVDALAEGRGPGAHADPPADVDDAPDTARRARRPARGTARPARLRPDGPPDEVRRRGTAATGPHRRCAGTARPRPGHRHAAGMALDAVVTGVDPHGRQLGRVRTDAAAGGRFAVDGGGVPGPGWSSSPPRACPARRARRRRAGAPRRPGAGRPRRPPGSVRRRVVTTVHRRAARPAA